MAIQINHIIKSASNWQPGVTFKREHHYNQKADVTLAESAMRMTALLQDEAKNTGTAEATGFDKVVLTLHQQMLKSGKNAEVFKEVPSDRDPARLELSRQATNYLLTALYGKEKLHQGVSDENPFAALDRLILSSMAFDDSGAFTSAERQLAFLEISTRDEEFIKQTFDLQASLRKKDDSIAWGEATSYLRDAQLATAMSEGERIWRGWPTADELSDRASFFMHQLGIEELDFPVYDNLKKSTDSALVVMVSQDKLTEWKSIPIKSLETGQKNISLVQAIVDTAISKKPRLDITGKEFGPQIALYVSIDSYKK